MVEKSIKIFQKSLQNKEILPQFWYIREEKGIWDELKMQFHTSYSVRTSLHRLIPEAFIGSIGRIGILVLPLVLTSVVDP
jgi:hypothetical protein